MVKVHFSGYVTIPIEGTMEAETYEAAKAKIMDLQRYPNNAYDYAKMWCDYCHINEIE